MPEHKISSYKIIEDGIAKGPFDSIAIVRRIKNGKLTLESLVVASDSDDKPTKAKDIPELQAIINEYEEDKKNNSSASYEATRSTSEILKDGFEFFKSKPDIAIGACIILILCVICYFVTQKLAGSYATFITSVLGYFLINIYCKYILQIKRGQHFNSAQIGNVISNSGLQALLFGLVFSIFALLKAILGLEIGLISLLVTVIILPVFILALFTYSDLHYSFSKGLNTSKRYVKSCGIDAYANLLVLVVLNLFGALLLGVGMVITLPITVSALTGIYEEFNLSVN